MLLLDKIRERRAADAAEPMYGLRTSDERGRTAILGINMLSTACNSIATGVLYTGFLLNYGISLVNVGIISLVAPLTSVLTLVSPSIMSRFRRRKAPLAICRLLYYVFTVLGITVIPELISDPGARITAFVVVLFIGHSINAVASPAYSSWHIRFFPERLRVRFFASAQVGNNLSALVTALVCSLIADAVSGTAMAQPVMIVMRYVAFAFALMDSALMLVPRELDWQTENAKGFRSIFESMRNKRFALTMVVVVGYTLPVALYSSFWNYYLLDSAKVSYTYISVINIVYMGFLFLLTPFWKRKLSKYSWFTIFWVGLAITALTNIPYAFVTSFNYLWFMTVIRLAQHFIGVGFNIAASNLAYVNLPEGSATGGMSCYIIISNAASLAGLAIGTAYIKAVGDLSFTLFGVSVGSVQQLMLISALLHLALAVFIKKNLRRLSPESDLHKLGARPFARAGKDG